MPEFAEFFRTCLPSVTKTLAALTSENRVVDDVAQEAFVLAQHRWDVLSGYDKPEAWVLKVALRRMRRWQHQHRRETELVALPSVDHIERAQDTETLHAALRQLSPRHSEVIALHHLLGYPVAEIAEILVVGESTVRTHLTRGRAELRKLLGGTW